MVRFSALTFLFVSVVAVMGLSLFFDAQNTGRLITDPDCHRFAYEHDVILDHTFWVAQGQAEYGRSYESVENPCTGRVEEGVYEHLDQDPPLEQYGRFTWGSGAVYGFQGGQEMKYGNIQFWYCPDGYRGRVILSNTEVCNSFDETYDFADVAMPRH